MALTKKASIQRLILQKECVIPTDTVSKQGMSKSEEISRLILPEEVVQTKNRKKKFPNVPDLDYEKRDRELTPNPRTVKAIGELTGIIKPLVDLEEIFVPF